jgi:spoIIIJ-associated protein
MTEQQFEGRSAAEAAIKACEALGTTRAALKYRVVSETGEHLERRVVIVVESSGSVPAFEPERSARPSRAEPARTTGYEMPPSSLTEEYDEPPRRSSAHQTPAAEGGRRSTSSRGGARQRGRSGGGSGNANGGGNGGSRREPREAREPREGRRPGGREPRSRPAHQDDGIEALLKLDAAQVEPPPRRPAIEADSPRTQRAVAVLADLLRLMQMDMQPTLVADDDAEMHIDLFGTDEQKMIGRKGEVLLALQFVLNRILHREADENDQIVVLDAGGYRERRRAALAQLARRLAERAVEQKKAVRLSPMSAHDRRVFHMTLKEIDGVVTRSEGDGLLRNLLIIPSEFAENVPASSAY